MPLLSNGMQHAPAWCEMTNFAIVPLAAGESRTFPRQAARERLLVTDGTCRVSFGGATHEAATDGTCRVSFGGATHEAATGDKYEIPDDAPEYTVVAGDEGAGVVTLSGTWGAETGGWGLFFVIEEEAPERGDPTDYPKRTRIDNHYHDCDEFYIILSGRGTVVSEGRHYRVGPGDCVATGMGDHHDVPIVESPLRAVFFETTLQGRKRRGHLWEHTHGPAEPQRGSAD